VDAESSEAECKIAFATSASVESVEAQRRVFVLDYPTHIVNLGSRHKAHGERRHPILALPAEIEFSVKNIVTAAP
jgi:hypothetical protein